jgi:N-acetylglucosamine-6-phosphate deacetylase
VIADEVHVDALVLELVRRAAGPRVVLVSDASPAAAAPPGRYAMGGIEIAGGADAVVRDAAGRLAGSALTLDAAVRGWRALTGATLAEALHAGSGAPAAACGLPARLSPGAPADLVLLGADGAVRRVMRAGEWLGDP